VAETYKGKVAIIQFAGVNCEYETADAVRSVGLEAALFRWNEDPDLLDGSVALILPGGFSYQDRIRAGVVAAKDRIMDKVSELAYLGRPVLGICNGAQVLVEAGLIPGIHWERVDLALAPNVMADREGYYCSWVHLRTESSTCIWTGTFSEGEVIPIPIAHAEGRFVTQDMEVLEEIKQLEEQGFSFEAAEASVGVMLKRQEPDYEPPFQLVDYVVMVEHRQGRGTFAEATVKVIVDGEVLHTAAEGNGPVNALDAALRKALIPVYPALRDFQLVDYKVRILDGKSGTAAKTRVLIDTRNENSSWSTVGASTNIIEASWQALTDSVEYGLMIAEHAPGG